MSPSIKHSCQNYLNLSIINTLDLISRNRGALGNNWINLEGGAVYKTTGLTSLKTQRPGGWGEGAGSTEDCLRLKESRNMIDPSFPEGSEVKWSLRSQTPPTENLKSNAPSKAQKTLERGTESPTGWRKPRLREGESLTKNTRLSRLPDVPTTSGPSRPASPGLANFLESKTPQISPKSGPRTPASASYSGMLAGNTEPWAPEKAWAGAGIR